MEYYTWDEWNTIFVNNYENTMQKQLDSAIPWIGMYVAAASAACALAMAADAVIGFRSKKLWFPYNEMLLNLAALGILVVTIAGNVYIHIVQILNYFDTRQTLAEEIGSTVLMLLSVLILCSSAVIVPTAKTYIESQYNQMHKRVSNDEQVGWGSNFAIDKLRIVVRRYWVMAESGSPQFVIARSVTCVTSGMMCLLTALTLLEARIRSPLVYKTARRTYCNYKWSINWILVIQSIGVAIGTIAPLLRWFNAAIFKSSKIGHKSFKDEFKVEAYWTQTLKHWRDSPLPLKIGHHKFRKVVHDAKRLLLNFCIGVQILIVLANKLVLLISAIFVKGVMFCFCDIKYLEASDSDESDGSMDFSRYVLLLEGEAELSKRTLKNICNEVDKLIQIVVTLTSIAISLPNITDCKSNKLLSAVSEGLYFAKLIEKNVEKNGELVSIRNAADVVWVGLELYRKWQDKDLQTAGLKGKTHKETLQKLSDIAEKTVTNFMTDTNNFLVQDPLNWPVKVIAANSMYRITQTILLADKDDHLQTDEELFERLSIMISDILAACLTNLARVIIFKCHNCSINDRERSMRQAAVILGESEEIIEILEQRELPSLDPEKSI
ncbi:hypothetical protein DH2020_042742 [Rehmannia glutinosa]|uniref:Uncharacterized protein n=1 Tax=Rehmannia glutinosa TaxID=99300 RepID=A0ABR0UMY1_REHGL